MAGLAVLVVLAYANSFTSGFVLDNRVIVLEDPRVRAVTVENLGLIASRGYWWPYANLDLYRPLTTVTYLLNYALLGNADRPGGYHAVNLALHLANVFLLYALVARVTRRFWLAVIAAAIAAAHPINTEAVTNIVGRADLLAALGVLTALYAHVRAAGSTAPIGWRLLEAIGVAIGVSSKESAIAVVAVIVVYDLLDDRADARAARFMAWLPAAVPTVVFLLLRWRVLSAAESQAFPFVDNPILGAPFWTGRLTALAVAGRYLALLVWPARLSADYSYAQIPLATGTTAEWLAWLTVASFVAVVVLLWMRQRMAFLALAAAVVVFLPASNLVVVSGTIMAERLLYLPLMFVAPVVAGAALGLARSAASQRLVIGAFALIVAVLAVRTSVRNRDWRDDMSIWSATVESAPRSFKSHSGLANALHDADPSRTSLERVVAGKEASLAILATVPNPAETPMPYYEGAVYYTEYADRLKTEGASAEAVRRAYERAAALVERYLALAGTATIDEGQIAKARLLQSTLYTRLSRGGQAVDVARASVGQDPMNPVAYRTLAGALVSASRADEAASALLTGFMLTGDQDLRAAVIELYRAGLDTAGCAVGAGPAGPTLNRDCALVARHLCRAAAETASVHRQAGRTTLADQAMTAVQGIDCSGR